jgi:3-methylfumaryl-CoA hydratase
MQATLDREGSLGEGDSLPPAWHWLYFFDAFRTSDLGRDGHTRLGISLPEFPLPRRMWAGGNIQWLNKVVMGTAATRATEIKNIVAKEGRTGSLIFVTMEHRVEQRGNLCIIEEQNIVYREAAITSTQVEPEQAESDSHFSQQWKFGSTELFRYSALTFNGHKIHYDSDYAREVEGYPNVVVHGPLLATLMLDLAVVNNRDVNQFSYRARSPICLPESLTTHGRVSGDSTQLNLELSQCRQLLIR